MNITGLDMLFPAKITYEVLVGTEESKVVFIDFSNRKILLPDGSDLPMGDEERENFITAVFEDMYQQQEVSVEPISMDIMQEVLAAKNQIGK